LPRWAHGLVIGKFLPPHKGHKHLIDTGRSQVDRLTVMICDRPEYGMDGEMRARWLREIHPNCEVVLIRDEIDDDDSRLWAENTKRVLGKSPDVVFTSEDYGDPYAKYLGCDHVLVDRGRVAVPCSGTMIRENSLENLDYLEPCVRAFFVKRVCVLGAESTGTTTMAEALAAHYETTWVPEYGREYWIEKMNRGGLDHWDESEFIHIASEQARREDLAARTANKIVICDTDAFTTSVWFERYIQRRSPLVEAVSEDRRYDLTFLTDINIPFEQDGFRDGEHIRHWMHDHFIERLNEVQRPFVLLAGRHEQRLAESVSKVDQILQRK
jgi:HTH-type transcriptional regulator, transcriptional repressor of NAD biosynthesis genes